jgi:hypothetical protein
MLNPQVLYIVEINDVDVSLAFSQARAQIFTWCSRCRQSRNMEIMTGAQLP